MGQKKQKRDKTGSFLYLNPMKYLPVLEIKSEYKMVARRIPRGYGSC